MELHSKYRQDGPGLMRVLHIATVGEDVTPVLVGLRELPVSKLILLYTEDARQQVEDLRDRLSGVLIPVEAKLVEGDPVTQVMKIAGEILQKEGHKYDEVFFNVSSGSKMLSYSRLPSALVHALQPVPEAYAPAEQARDHHDGHVVDKSGGKELADHGGTTADAYILAGRGLSRGLERVGRRSVDEVERRATLHLDRRARVMGEDEDRCVERRVGTPPALPLLVGPRPALRAELVAPHDLHADARPPVAREGVVDARVAVQEESSR